MRIGVFGLPIITRSLLVESLFDASSLLIGRTLISSTALLPQALESKVVSIQRNIASAICEDAGGIHNQLKWDTQASDVWGRELNRCAKAGCGFARHRTQPKCRLTG
jgi:hypothetical protein